MCMMFYLGSETPIPREPWDKSKNLDIHVADLLDSDRDVLLHFTKPHVCYVGAYEGCGCGFHIPEDPVDDPETEEATQNSRTQLVELLRSVLQTEDFVELYACWDGDQGCDPEHRDVMVPEDLLSTSTNVREREFLIVKQTR